MATSRRCALVTCFARRAARRAWPWRGRARRQDHAGWVEPSIVLVASNPRPLASTAQAMRASLLASAIASTLWCSLFLAASIHDLSPCRSQLNRLDENDPRRLHEQHAQIAISPFRYLAQDRA